MWCQTVTNLILIKKVLVSPIPMWVLITITSRLNIGNDVVEYVPSQFLVCQCGKTYVHLVAEDFELKLDELVVIDDSNFKSEGTAKIVLNRIGRSW